MATAAILFVGVQARLPGLLAAAVALNGAHFVELVVLWWGARRSLRLIAERPIEQLALAGV